MSLCRSRCANHVRSLALTLTLSLLAGFAGCGGSSSSTGGGGTPKVLKAIAASAAQASLTVGATEQFSATATYSDGSTADITKSAAWTDANAKVASISPSGMAAAIAPGSTTVTASLDGVSGSATLTVPAPAITLSSIALTPGSATLAIGATQQFAVTGTYSDGSTADVTASATWSIAPATVATVNAAGLAAAVAAGSATLTATVSGVQGSATLTVPPSLSSVSVTPNNNPSIAYGATQQFTATATYSDGSTQNVTATSAWSSSKTAVATITSAGIATAVSAGSTTITASFNGLSGNTTLAVTGITSISVTPASPSFAVGATQQFTATATNSDGTTKDITSTATWKSSNTAVATINASGLATGVTAGSPTISATSEGKTGTDTATVTTAVGTGVNIPTWHVDNNRSGLNPNETTLTPANVASANFGKLFSLSIDGYAYAEPLLISNVMINGATHNVLYVATENDSVYAFDADNYGTGLPLWKTPLLQANESPAGGTVKPYQGITSTPVIDPASNTIYVVSEQTSSAHGTTYRLNALDITTGAQKPGSPVTIQASVPGTNSTNVGNVVSLPAGCVQRAALLLTTIGTTKTVYIGVGSCHSGWLVSYNATSLTQTGVFNASPNLDGEGTYGGAGGVWMGSGGPVADSAGNVYISTGNGPYDTTQKSYADSILKFSPTLQLLDSFTPEDYGYMNCEDSDLAAGGLLMIPGSGQVVGGGKMGRLYLINTAKMGGEQAFDAGVVQRLFVEQGISGSQPYPSSCVDSDSNGNPLPNGKTWYVGGPNDTNGDTTNGINSYEIFGTSAYFNGSLYLGVTPTTTGSQAVGVIRRFTYTPGSSSATGQLAAEESTPLNLNQQQPQNTRGTTPFISANGSSDGILWTIDQGQPLQSPLAVTHATLYAYDATNLGNELYSSDAISADQAGIGIKFSSPIVANGKVYISTGTDPVTATNPKGEIDVYGLK